jgi:hypothetical protein
MMYTFDASPGGQASHGFWNSLGRGIGRHVSLLPAAGAIRSLTTEGTEATEAGRKGFPTRLRALPSFQSVSVNSVLSVVKSGANLRETVLAKEADHGNQ